MALDAYWGTLTLDSSRALRMCAVVGGSELALRRSARRLMLDWDSCSLKLTCSSYVQCAVVALDRAKFRRSSMWDDLRRSPSALVGHSGSMAAPRFSSTEDTFDGWCSFNHLLTWSHLAFRTRYSSNRSGWQSKNASISEKSNAVIVKAAVKTKWDS